MVPLQDRSEPGALRSTVDRTNNERTQPMNDQEQRTGLRTIYDLLADSRQSYLEAYNRTRDGRTKDLLRALSWERIALESELMAELRRLDPSAPEGDGLGQGDPHHAWIQVRDALATSDNDHLLAACERGEGSLLARYDELLEGGPLDMGTRDLLTKQRAQVLGNLHTVRSRSLHAETGGR